MSHAEEDEPAIRLKINGKMYELSSFDDLTLDETGLIEDLMGGVPIEDMSAGDFALKKVMKALAYIFLSRENSAFTFADAGRLKLSDFESPDDDPDESSSNGREPGKDATPKPKRKGGKASTAS